MNVAKIYNMQYIPDRRQRINKISTEDERRSGLDRRAYKRIAVNPNVLNDYKSMQKICKADVYYDKFINSTNNQDINALSLNASLKAAKKSFSKPLTLKAYITKASALLVLPIGNLKEITSATNTKQITENLITTSAKTLGFASSASLAYMFLPKTSELLPVTLLIGAVAGLAGAFLGNQAALNINKKD